MKSLKILLAVAVVVGVFAIGFFWDVKKDIFFKSTKTKIQQITNTTTVEDKLFFTVDSLNDPDLGIKQSLWHQLANGEKQEIKFTLPTNTIKYRSQYFSDFIKEIPTDSPYKFLYLYDINVPEATRLMYLDPQTNIIKDAVESRFGSFPYYFSPDYKYIAVLGFAIQNLGLTPKFNYTNYVDIVDTKTLKTMFRHFYKTEYPGEFEMLTAGADAKNKWSSNSEFNISLYNLLPSGIPSATPSSIDIINIDILSNVKTSIDNKVYVCNFDINDNRMYLKINENSYAPIDGSPDNYLSAADFKIYSLPDNKEQVVFTNSSSPYMYIFDSDHTVTLKKVLSKTDWTIVESQNLPKSLEESFVGRRDIFVSPDANFGIALNETTGVIIDLVQMKEVKTFDMPKGYMAYANKNGMIVNSIWTAANVKTKWISSTIFNMELYSIKKTAVTKSSKSMKVDISEFKIK